MDMQTSLFDPPGIKADDTAGNYYYTDYFDTRSSTDSTVSAKALTHDGDVSCEDPAGRDGKSNNGKSGKERENPSKAGIEKTVYPFKSGEQIGRMGKWLYENSHPKYFLAYVLGINLGLRANELLSLRWSDVLHTDGSFKYGQELTDTSDRISVYQKKTDKRRGLWLNEACVKALRWYMTVDLRWKANDYIFASRKGNDPIHVDTLRHELKRAADACQIKQNVGTHSLRKTFGYAQYQANHDIVFLQRLFGHSSALTTMRYIGIADEEEKRAYHDGSIDVLDMI